MRSAPGSGNRLGGHSALGDSFRQLMETLAQMEEQPEIVVEELLGFIERVERASQTAHVASPGAV
jgi:hypothetical protein